MRLPTAAILATFGLALCLGGCPKSGSTDTTGPKGGPSSDAGPEETLRPATSVECRAAPCLFHAGTSTYHECLAGGAGTCFHYGPSCTPADECMFDPASSTYKSCSSSIEGRCETFGAACTPTGGCMIDPSDGMYRSCADVVDGRCKSYGDLCDPTASAG